MAIWKPEIPVKSFMPLELNRGNPVRYIYQLPGNQAFPVDAVVVLTLSDSAGVVLDAWTATVTGGKALFSETIATGASIPVGSEWAITATMGAAEPQLLMQGNVIRVEPPVILASIDPNAQLSFPYTFGTPGLLIDPVWNVLAGNPQVYDNSGASLPNAIASGGTGFPDVTMIHNVTLNSDAPRLAYEIVPSGDGDVWIVMASSADASTCSTIHHSKSGGTHTIGVEYFAGSSGDHPLVTRAVAHESFVGGYDPISRSFFLYLSTDLSTPLFTLSDAVGGSTGMPHDDAHRYFGLMIHSAGSAPGIEVAGLTVSDGISFS